MDGVIVEKIPINRFMRKRVGFHFGMFVFISIAEKHNVGMDEFEKIDNNQIMLDALYFANKWYAFNNNTREASIETIEKAIRFMPAAQLQRIYKTMNDAKIGGRTIMQIAEDEGKKKQQQSK